MIVVEYHSNNSGGNWWLSDQDWKNLEAAGWEVEWFAAQPGSSVRAIDAEGRWLDALASRAFRRGLTLHEAIEEWEMIVGQDADELGCYCCGHPHNFYESKDRRARGRLIPRADASVAPRSLPAARPENSSKRPAERLGAAVA